MPPVPTALPLVVDDRLTPAPQPDPRRGETRADPLSAYLRDLGRLSLLDRDAEHALAVEYRRSGHKELAQTLVSAHLRLVVKIAHEYRWARQEIADLIECGNLGLVMAVTKFDPDRGVRLSTYASFWIRAMILRHIVETWRLVRIGTTRAQRQALFRLSDDRAQTDRLLAQHLRLPEESLDAPVGQEDGAVPRLDLLAATAPGPDVQVEQAELRAAFHRALADFEKRLTGRDRLVFRGRWLVEAPVTLQQLADRFGVSRERVRQLERRILDRLRTFLEQRGVGRDGSHPVEPAVAAVGGWR